MPLCGTWNKGISRQTVWRQQQEEAQCHPSLPRQRGLCSKGRKRLKRDSSSPLLKVQPQCMSLSGATMGGPGGARVVPALSLQG
jgi:hypothetical protein